MCTFLESSAQVYLPTRQVARETCLPRTRTHLPQASGQGLCHALYVTLEHLHKTHHLNLVAALSLALASCVVRPSVGRRPWRMQWAATICRFCNTCPPTRDDAVITEQTSLKMLSCSGKVLADIRQVIWLIWVAMSRALQKLCLTVWG